MAGHVVLPWSHRAFSLLKRWALGTYHGLRRKHIDTYLNEFVFRYNRRFYRHVSFEALLGLATHHEPTGYWDIIKRAGPPRPRLLHTGLNQRDNLIGQVLREGRPFPNLDRRQRKADGLLGRGWNYRGELLGFHGVVFQASSGMCVGGIQLRGATEWDEPGTFISSGVVSVADRAPARTRSRPRHPAPTRSGLTRCHAAAARRSIGATL